MAAQALEAPVHDVQYQAGATRLPAPTWGLNLGGTGRAPARAADSWISTSAVAGPSWPNGCHICEVELTRRPARRRWCAYASVNDVGRVVNPLIVRGQLKAAPQGLGQALSEAVAYDAASGQPLRQPGWTTRCCGRWTRPRSR